MGFYVLTIVLGAFLLFQVEPVIAKVILPWFGGSAAVWSACLVFFQLVLLFGYLYAHLLTRHLRPRWQALLHSALLLLSFAVLPIYPNPRWETASAGDPSLRILCLLAATVGLPYFLLSTTGPLLQAWYARQFNGAVPYRLYALSNAGSLFALLSYPVLIEPMFTTHQQTAIWSVAYVAFALLCGITAFRAGTAGRLELAAVIEPGAAPGASQYWMWMALAACPSVLLLAITNHMSQNIAPIPFLWILPLSIYLLTFILCFEGRRWYRRGSYLRLLVAGMGAMAIALTIEQEGALPIKVLLPLFAIGLYTCCMVCHGELARMKPHSRYLTHFYLMISAGGALGGIFVALLAPRIFKGVYELPLGLAACAVLVVVVLKQDPGVTWLNGFRQPAPLVATALTLGFISFPGLQIRDTERGARVLARNFYGGLKTMDRAEPAGLIRVEFHGTINHGQQFLDLQRRDLPIAYYSPTSGVGRALDEAGSHGPIRVGVIGLGAGTLAAYGRPGDYFRFYEINPLVLDLARTEFTFLRDCHARYDVVLGDGRLSLARESSQRFDVLVVDAFSGDSVPVHLLTREAFDLYFRHLNRAGVLAVHVTNKYLNLVPVVHRLAEAAGKQDAVIEASARPGTGIFPSTWVLVSGRPAIRPPHDRSRPWTDDYSNLFQSLR